MTDDDKALVERLLQVDGRTTRHYRNPEGPEAAARIEALSARVAELETEACLVWSNQHGAWWRPKSAGYTRVTKQAGIYTRAEAVRISHKGRDGWCFRKETPDEIVVRLADIPEDDRPATQPGDGESGARRAGVTPVDLSINDFEFR